MTDASFGPREAQPAETMLAWAASQGWNMFGDRLGPPQPGDDVRRRMGALEEEAQRVAGAAARIFGTADGRAVLEWLCDQSLRRPVFVVGLGDQALTYAAQREGQNNIVFLLMKLIAFGREEKPPHRAGVE